MRFVVMVCVTLSLVFFALEGLAEEAKKTPRWELAGEIGEGYNNLYIDTESITYNKEAKTVAFIGKRVLTPKGIAERRKDFEESIERAERESGGKVEDKDKLFEKAVLPMTVYYNRYEIVCDRQEIARMPSLSGSINLVVLDKITEGTTEHKLMERLCQAL